MATIAEALALALQYHQAGNVQQAEQLYRQILLAEPAHVETLHLLGVLAHQVGWQDLAVQYIGQATALNPREAAYHANLGMVYHALDRLGEAEHCYREALRLRPDLPEAHNNLGNTVQALGRRDEAVARFREALRLRPDYPDAHDNLGRPLKDMGLLDEAIAAFRRAVELRPSSAAYHSNLLYTLHFHPDSDAPALAEEHRCWNERHAEPLAQQIRPHENDADPERRLRVGYVSPDLCRHVVGLFLLPLIEGHDRRHFEVFCYASVAVPDAVTEQLRGQVACWRDVADLSDERLAEVVRADRIDILVDLSAHMGNHRLLTFARKPAPVQVTYLAYCSTTGLRTMDYRLTDPFLDPPGQPQPYYAEESVWLPETYWCYRPLLDVPPGGPLPARAAGHVTFGCLNNFCKVTAPTLAAWRELLGAVPGSRLLLHAHAGSQRERVRAFFAEGGVDAGRVEFVDHVPLPAYLALYDRIDVGLDPFPYAGGTTTCDALWRGVPVISLAGQTAVARAGLSLLSNAGLPEWVAHTPEEYVGLATDLARDLPRLVSLRSGLRGRLERSPLTDAPRFARNVEGAFRWMWRRWCATRAGPR